MVIFLTLFHTTGKRRGCLSKLACTLKRPWGTKTESFTSFPNSSLLLSSLQGSVHALHCPFSYHSNAGSSLGHAHVSLCFIMSESCSPCMRPSRVLASPNMPFVAHARFLLLFQEAFLVSFMLVIVAQACPTGCLPCTLFLVSPLSMISWISCQYRKPADLSLVFTMC